MGHKRKRFLHTVSLCTSVPLHTKRPHRAPFCGWPVMKILALLAAASGDNLGFYDFTVINAKNDLSLQLLLSISMYTNPLGAKEGKNRDRVFGLT